MSKMDALSALSCFPKVQESGIAPMQRDKEINSPSAAPPVQAVIEGIAPLTHDRPSHIMGECLEQPMPEMSASKQEMLRAAGSKASSALSDPLSAAEQGQRRQPG